ncbi:type I pullulanase [Clostridium thermobutyricum]|uniref:type I pullulanase n=1 Tax=Clostridium thermobutyricum TaxID=29372 RepID=UPI0029422B91|nr:type I pullulanase [Clostridium thermobutyricum]
MNIKEIYSEYKNNKSEIKNIFSSNEFKNLYHFNGMLGAIYRKEETMFRLWTPVAKEVKVKIYEKEGKNNFKFLFEKKLSDLNGIFEGIILGDLSGKYYRYVVNINDKIQEVVDPYSKAVSINGIYGMIIDLEKTNPEGWTNDIKPELKSPVDSIIYETHVRDFTIDINSGVKNKGKFIGLIEENTKYKDVSTGLEHLKELGITHLHLLPVFDYKTVDEEKESGEYNWGYDPLNYNSLEGSYSLNPYNGEERIKEFKEMILNLHKSGIRVVMDVVYNHVFQVENSNFEKIIPMYYFREKYDGSFSNGSGCGNETASERSMVKKFILDSILYYTEEYHIDGFRFDLMGLHDIDMMKEIRLELDKIDKSIIIYGEGWVGGESALDYNNRSIKDNIYKFGQMQIAAFNDDIRDAVKGNVFDENNRGFASGGIGYCEKLKSGIVASTRHNEVYYKWWANEPYQTINYSSSHDNYTLWDKLQKSLNYVSEDEKIKINKLIATIILTSQGIPFIHSGEEFLRTKISPDGQLIENSYNSGDNVNKLDWNRKIKYKDVFEYYKKLINLRKNHKIFRMDKMAEIEENISFKHCGDNFIYYEINGENIKDYFKKSIVVYNGYERILDLEIEGGEWDLILDGNDIDEQGISKIKNKISINGRTAIILVQKK